MGLKETMEAASVTAVEAFGNLLNLVTYVSVARGTYNSSTNSYPETLTEVGPFRAPCYRGKDEKNHQNPEKIEQKLLIPSLYLPGIAIKESDYVLVTPINGGDPVRWEIYRIDSVPGDPIFKFILRVP